MVVFLGAENFQFDSSISAIAATAVLARIEGVSVILSTLIVCDTLSYVIKAVVPLAAISKLIAAHSLLVIVVALLFVLCVEANILLPLRLRFFASAARTTHLRRNEFALIVPATGRRVIYIPHACAAILVLDLLRPIRVPAGFLVRIYLRVCDAYGESQIVCSSILQSSTYASVVVVSSLRAVDPQLVARTNAAATDAAVLICSERSRMLVTLRIMLAAFHPVFVVIVAAVSEAVIRLTHLIEVYASLVSFED